MASQTDSHFPMLPQMTTKQVKEYLTRKKSIILPLGVIEQHGHHLPLSTDALIATHMARLAGTRSGVLVAPTMFQSFSGGGLEGTINISPAVMSLVISDTLVSLASQGFRNFYLLLCHGGSENARALNDALRMLLRNNPIFQKALVSLFPVWKLSSKGMGWSKALAEGDWHAGWLETSMVMAFEPELVHMDQLAVDAEPAFSQLIAHPDNYQRAEKIVDDPFVIPRMTQRPDVRIGVMGWPDRATPELGRQLVDDMVNNLSARIDKLEATADGVYRPVAFVPEPLLLTDD